MSKRKWYHGNEMMAYIMPLDKESLPHMDSIRFYTIDTSKWKYTFKFVYDKDVDIPFKDRIETASSKCKICFVLSKYQINPRTVTIKNLESGKQVLSTYEDILNNLLTII